MRCREIYYMSFIIFLDVIYGATSMKTITISIGGNTYQNKVVAYVHAIWPNLAKVIKTTAPKFASMKGTHLNRSHDLWLHDILTNEKCMW